MKFGLLLPVAIYALHAKEETPEYLGRIDLSYGRFATYFMPAAEMNEAIENCNVMNGRLPKVNNLEDFHKIGDLSVRTDYIYTWTSYIDGTLNGAVEHDGNGTWYDYYDGDVIGLLWQSRDLFSSKT